VSPTTSARRTRGSLVSGLAVVALCSAWIPSALSQEPAAQAVTYPTPPDGWWSVLQGGERATYELRRGGVILTQDLRLEQVSGPSVTLSVSTARGRFDLGPVRTETVDLSQESAAAGYLPTGATVELLGEETLVLGPEGQDGEQVVCQRYRVTLPEGRTLLLWRSPRLPPVFHGGCVQVVEDSGDGPVTLRLIAYGGPWLDE
jgi:hypothetical protein